MGISRLKIQPVTDKFNPTNLYHLLALTLLYKCLMFEACLRKTRFAKRGFVRGYSFAFKARVVENGFRSRGHVARLAIGQKRING